jgi:hypothetical protein
VGEATTMGGDLPSHPCFLARSKTLAIVMGLSRAKASSLYLDQRLRLSASSYPGAWREAASSISQSCGSWSGHLAASCANPRASFIHRERARHSTSCKGD